MASRKDRQRRDQAGVGPDPDVARHHGLVPMQDLEKHRIAEGEPDIRGWDVRTLSGREIGEIDELLVDPERGEVVMLDIEMRDGGVHAEVPIRSVQLDRKGKAVIVDSGDLDARPDARARDRMVASDRGEREIRDRSSSEPRSDDNTEDTEEVVIERKPIVEEVVLRRRNADQE